MLLLFLLLESVLLSSEGRKDPPPNRPFNFPLKLSTELRRQAKISRNTSGAHFSEFMRRENKKLYISMDPAWFFSKISFANSSTEGVGEGSRYGEGGGDELLRRDTRLDWASSKERGEEVRRGGR